VIVVVDPREDDISSRLKAWSDRLQLRIMTGDRGVHAGGERNRGAALSRGRFLLFVDADDVVAEGYICAMAEAPQSQESGYRVFDEMRPLRGWGSPAACSGRVR
jgi:Glycosyl transferase family 2